MAARLTYRRRHSYNTASNAVRKVKTPGGRLVFQTIPKRASGRKCGDCGCKILGVAHFRPQELAKVSKRQKTVARAYGGSRCGGCTRQRIVRAFLIEEQKIVKRVLKSQAAATKKEK
eukprot:TRINITY_DN14012_c0_g1_i1.p1 TRINITY_DN14012_c0_g1~~TRINITY_DN14012_c0_g1_i1.p1  ORF type:complete len:117 (-),score=38.56 TRINITY_DN14012_c0_g1_i1:152-502(-)